MFTWDSPAPKAAVTRSKSDGTMINSLEPDR